MSRLLRLSLPLVVAILGSVPIGAQAPEPGAPPPDTVTSRLDPVIGAELSVLVPRGEFREQDGWSIGYGLRGAVALARRVVDLGAVFRSISRSWSQTDDVTVAAMMRTFALEARVLAPFRTVRPYIAGSVGAAYFGTEISEYRCCDANGEWHDELEEIRRPSITPMAATRVGIVIDVTGWAPGQPVMSIDLGMDNHYGGRATYEVGSEVVRTRTNARVYSIGLSIRGGRTR